MPKESRKVQQRMLIAAYQAGRLAAQFDHQMEPHMGGGKTKTSPLPRGDDGQKPGDPWHH